MRRRDTETPTTRALGWLAPPEELADGPLLPLVAAKRKVALEPESPAAHAALGWCYLQERRLGLARSSYETALGFDASHGPAVIGLAAVLVLSDDVNEARAHLLRADVRCLLPEDARAYLRELTRSDSPDAVEHSASDLCAHARELAERGEHAAAARRLAEATTLAPDDAQTWHELGTVTALLGRTVEARAAYEAALVADPDHARAWCGLGVLFAERGDRESARQAFERAVAIEPTYARALMNLGLCLRKENQLDEALDLYRRALEVRPDCAETLYNCGVLQTDREQWTEAIAMFRRALDTAPDHGQAHSGLGIALERAGRLEEAIAAHRAAVSLRPDDPVAHYLLGIAENGARHELAALRQYRILRSLDADLSRRLLDAISS